MTILYFLIGLLLLLTALLRRSLDGYIGAFGVLIMICNFFDNISESIKTSRLAEYKNQTFRGLFLLLE